MEVLRILHSEPAVKRRRNIVERDEQLEKVVRNYHAGDDHMDFLTGIALLLIKT